MEQQWTMLMKQLFLMQVLQMFPKLSGNTNAEGANRILKNATIAVSLKYFSNFWRSLEMPLINPKI